MDTPPTYQLSPVKKRIKENKDQYIMADNYSSSRPVSLDNLGPSGGGQGRTLEVITISDSNDKVPEPAKEGDKTEPPQGAQV